MSSYRTLFDARGARYNLANRQFPEARAEEAEQLLAHIEIAPERPWLDVGAGGGFLADRVAASGAPGIPVGCDESAAFLAEALGYRMRAVVDYERLPYRDCGFGAAGCLAVLHHAPEPVRVIAEMLRVTDRRGRVVVGDVAGGSRASRFLNEFVDAHTDTGHAGRFHEPGALRDLFAQAGGRDIRAEAVEIHWNFQRREDALAFSRDLFGLRPETEGADLSAALEYVGLALSEGRWRLPWSMVFASATAS